MTGTKVGTRDARPSRWPTRELTKNDISVMSGCTVRRCRRAMHIVRHNWLLILTWLVLILVLSIWIHKSVMELNYTYHVKNESKIPDMMCQVKEPTRESIGLTKKLFLSAPPKDCSHQTRLQICRLTFSEEKYSIVCDPNVCKSVSLGSLNDGDGVIRWTPFKSMKRLENAITRLMSTAHHGFCYIECLQPQLHSGRRTPGGHSATQLLVLPPHIYEPHKVKQEGDNAKLNINLVLIDSTSREHFYRSMPKSVKALEALLANTEQDAMVLDFKLVQGIKSRTFENAQALFSGLIDLNGKPFDDFLELPPKPMPVETMFKPLKQLGYKTLWLEDLCWSKSWGISKSLRVANADLPSENVWKKLRQALNKASIDDIGISYSVCEVLDSLNKTDPFHGLDTICYNGQHHHENIFEYLTLYQAELSRRNIPFITFYENNVGHDDVGLRIQTLDNTLSKYVKFASTLKRTFTIILSDHGNTYGPYVNTIQGRMEVYHPFMFIIIPPDVAASIGKKKMAALRVNQDKLLSVLDVHYALKSFIPNSAVTSDQRRNLGLFDELPSNRPCDQIPMFPQSLCICEGLYGRTASNDSKHALIAEFALGELNNELHKQFIESNPSAKSGFGYCLKLTSYRFGNVVESHRNEGTGDYNILSKFDMFMKRPGGGTDSDEVFSVVVKSGVGESSDMMLVSFLRMSTYSIFKPCADKGVALPLCVCDLHKEKRSIYMSLPDGLTYQETVFGVKTRKDTVQNTNECVLSLSRTYDSGVVFEIANACNKTIGVRFTVKTNNLDFSNKIPQIVSLNPGEVKFIAVARQSIIERPWKYAINISTVETYK